MPQLHHEDESMYNNPPRIDLSVEDLSYLMNIATMKFKELKVECKRTGAKQTTLGFNNKRTKHLNLMATRLGGHYNYNDLPFLIRMLLEDIFCRLEKGEDIRNCISNN